MGLLYRIEFYVFPVIYRFR